MIMIIILSCSAGNCDRATCPDCLECVVFCNCPPR
jgi:hypothetical protein